MADLQHETAKRSGDLAAQLAAEVRAGRPERTRLRAYCGCEAARFVVGLPYQPAKPPRHWEDRCIECDDLGARILGPDSRGDPILDLCSCTLPEYQDLPDWLAGLQRLAWAPPLWVPCSTCGCGADCPTLSSHPANVDPAQWVLAVAACGVARAAQIDGCYEQKASLARACSRTKCAPRIQVIECAEAWCRQPDLATARHLRDTAMGLVGGSVAPAGPFLRLAEVVSANGSIDVSHHVDLVLSFAQIIGPDAAREAAARAVLEVV